jgi:uncharacterized damage-inducible protein DinB
MKQRESDLGGPFLVQAQRLLRHIYLPRIARCLRELSSEQIWWRPNPASNSVGNLVLHLAGNVRQWVIAGLGGASDTRRREREFQERGPVSRAALLAGLQRTVREACSVLGKASSQDLSRFYTIQAFRVTGLQAVFHVSEHFSHHAGQIILATKMLRAKDLGFTRLPGVAKSKRVGTSIPSL